MKKIVAGIVVIIIIGVVLLTIGQKSTKTTTTGDTMSGMNNAPSQSSSTTPAATNSVVISNFSFSPASITVKKGTTVTWTNKDSTAHTVTENDGKDGPKSTTLNPGQNYSFTFNAAGSFAYICSIHPNMTGTVTVTE